MDSVFAERLSGIRKEKNIPQKTAAENLGVSQALLSHYEKGIRECSPAFIVRAAAYYDVTADYLLGLSEKTKNMNEVFSENELLLDGEAVSQTVYRALVWLGNKSAEISAECSQRVMNIYQLTLYKLLTELYLNGNIYDLPIEIPSDEAAFFASVAESVQFRNLRDTSSSAALYCPLSVKTVVKHSEAGIRASVNNLSVK